MRFQLLLNEINCSSAGKSWRQVIIDLFIGVPRMFINVELDEHYTKSLTTGGMGGELGASVNIIKLITTKTARLASERAFNELLKMRLELVTVVMVGESEKKCLHYESIYRQNRKLSVIAGARDHSRKRGKEMSDFIYFLWEGYSLDAGNLIRDRVEGH